MSAAIMTTEKMQSNDDTKNEQSKEEPPNDPQSLLFVAIDANRTEEVKVLVRENPDLNLNCFDVDGLTPLQHAVYKNNYAMCDWLLEHGADVDLTNHTHGYTPLMFAAIGGHNEIVELLLNRGADPTITNSVRRDAAAMASFVACHKAVAIINHFVPYKYFEPYTRPQSGERKPRLEPASLGRNLYSFVKQHNLHPIKVLLRLRECPQLLLNSNQVTAVLENLMSRAIKPPINDDSFALKLHYLSWIITSTHECLVKRLETKTFDESNIDAVRKTIDTLVKRLIIREDCEDSGALCSQRADQLIRDCIVKFPYAHLSIFQTVVYALANRSGEFSSRTCALSTLNQVLKGPKGWDNIEDICAVCGELCKTKKCSRCKSINYCGPECSKIHWFIHKKTCNPVVDQKLPEGATAK